MGEKNVSDSSSVREEKQKKIAALKEKIKKEAITTQNEINEAKQ